MKYLKFKNANEIQPAAIYLLGASTKRNQQNKIGFFGSGNKFALAYLLRNGYKVNLFGGNKEIVITTEQQFLGDQSFNVVFIDGKQTSITTEFGAKWKLWQALREIYSNCMDEGQESIEIVNSFDPCENETHYYIEMRAELLDWFSNFNNYFSENKEVIFECKYGKILKKHDQKAHIYRKGIRVYETENNSLYDYDFDEIEITEDRIVKYNWYVGEKIWKIIYSCKDKDVLRYIFNNVGNQLLIENSSTGYSDITSNEISEECKQVLKEMKLCNQSMAGYLSAEESLSTQLLPPKVFNSIMHVLDDKNKPDAFKVGVDGVIYRKFEFSEIQEQSIKKIIDFCREGNFEYLLDYDIIGGYFENKQVLGYADKKDKVIVLSDIGVDKGCNMILEIIIEEYIHLKYDANDNTRKFQDGCIAEMVKIMKIRNAFIL